MAEYDLYAEVKCKQCGNMRQKVASFCPHCGHVVEESWWEKLMGVFRSEEAPSIERKGGRNVVSGLLTLGFAAYLLYNAVEKESIQSLIVALLMFFLAIRSWFSGSSEPARIKEEDTTNAKEVEGDEVISERAPSDKFFCENCGTEVSSSAVVCPKCGMQFAE